MIGSIRRGCVWAALALSGLGACATWHPVSGADPAAALRASTRPEVRLLVTGWREPVMVRAPQVVGDSLIGTRILAPGERHGPRVAVPLAAVARLEEYRGDPPPTVVIPLVLLVGAAVLLVLGSLSSIN